MNLQYQPPIASITVDCVLFGFNEGKLKVLLIKRASDPEQGKWALPGGFMEPEETLEMSARRVLEMLTGVAEVYMQQLKVFSDINRHPSARVITVAYYALVNPDNYPLKPSWHASEAYWCELDRLPALGFDHKEILETAEQTLRKDIQVKPLGFELLPKKFTLHELQNLYEAILNHKLDRRNFRRKLKSLAILNELNEVKKGAHKDAYLYSFDKKAYDKLVKEGYALLV
jgi:8-oxo-dGTP diphosphatase